MGAVGYVLLDASALIKRHIIEIGSDRLEEFLKTEPCPFTTPFCFYEALSAFKRKKLKNEISKEDYIRHCTNLIIWFNAFNKNIKDINFEDPSVVLKVKCLVNDYDMDFSDAFQIVSIQEGFSSRFCLGSETILITADRALYGVAVAKGIKVWNIADPYPIRK